MAEYWKKEILADYHAIWREDELRSFCGVVLDPEVFIPLYLGRLLKRKQLEKALPEPGHYKVQIKVCKIWLTQLTSDHNNHAQVMCI